MKVILLKNVPKVGKKDEIVTVPDGYAHNALLPRKLAIVATDQAIAGLERNQQNNIAKRKEQHALLDQAIKRLAGDTLIYKVRKNEQGHLFSKVTEHDVSKALFNQHHIDISPKLLTIKNGPVKQTGHYVVEVRDGEYRSEFTLVVE